MVNGHGLGVHDGCINRQDIDLLFRTDSIDDAYDFIVRELAEYAIGEPGATL